VDVALAVADATGAQIAAWVTEHRLSSGPPR